MLPISVVSKHSGSFEWGVSDCVQFAADAVEAVSGFRPDLPVYSNESEARALTEARSLRDRVLDVAREVSRQESITGDVVVSVFGDGGPICGVVDRESGVFWMKGEVGIVPVDLSLALWVFRCHKQ